MIKLSLITLLLISISVLNTAKSFDTRQFLSSQDQSFDFEQTTEDQIFAKSNIDDSIDSEDIFNDITVEEESQNIEFGKKEKKKEIKDLKMEVDEVKSFTFHFKKAKTYQYFKFEKTSKEPSTIFIQAISDKKGEALTTQLYASSKCDKKCDNKTKYPNQHTHCNSDYKEKHQKFILKTALYHDCIIYVGVRSQFSANVNISIAHRSVPVYTDSQDVYKRTLDLLKYEDWRFFKYVKTGINPSSIHIQGNSTGDDNQKIYFYASSKCFKTCDLTIFPTQRDCELSQNQNGFQKLTFELQSDCIIHFGVYLPQDNSKLNIAIAHRPINVLTSDKSNQTVQLNFAQGEMNRYLAFNKISKGSGKLTIYGVTNSNKQDDITLYASSDCNWHCIQTTFPNNDTFCDKGSSMQFRHKIISLDLYQNCTIYFNIERVITAVKEVNITMKYKHYQEIYTDKIKNQTAKIELRSYKLAHHFTYKKLSKGRSDLSMKGIAKTSSNKVSWVSFYASSDCFENCQVTTMPSPDNNCKTSASSKDSNFLDMTLDSECTIYFGVYIGDVDIINDWIDDDDKDNEGVLEKDRKKWHLNITMSMTKSNS